MEDVIDSVPEPGRDCWLANPDTKVTGDAGCEDMTINAMEVIEECLSKGNYVAKPTEGSETSHDQPSTSSGYPNELNNSTNETLVEKEVPYTEHLKEPSESLQPNYDQLSTSSGYPNKLNNSTDKTAVEKEAPYTEHLKEPSESLQPDNDQPSISSGYPNELNNSTNETLVDKQAPSTEHLKEPSESLQLNNDQPSISSGKTNTVSNSPEPPSKQSKTNKDLLKQVLLKSTIAASKKTLPVPTLKKVEIFTPETETKWYDVQNNLITPRLISKNLPEAFNSLPIFGRPGRREKLEQFQDKMIRDFIGCDLNDDQYRNLSYYCSPENAKTGKELSMPSPVPMLMPQAGDSDATKIYSDEHKDSNLCVVKKHKMREERETNSKNFIKRLKYRGIRLMPLNQQEMEADVPNPAEDELEPGRDMLFHIRIYRPFYYNLNKKNTLGQLAPCRHSIFSRDAVISGRSPLHALRESLICPNDVDARHHVANAWVSDIGPGISARELFPSGFMFINNVFYVDDRPGCKDMSAVVREWAVKRGIGAFAKRPMNVKMQDVSVRLCHPEVYVHQGNCEHVFTISEVRLVNASDPLNISHYPCYTSLSQHQSVYCTTCAEFCAKWIVVGTDKVPFDPAFFCDNCLKCYLYKEGRPVEDFKLFGYKSNETNILKIHF